MKKKIITVIAIITVLGITVPVYAAATSNMTPEVFLENRLERLTDALQDEVITQAEYDEMYEHLNERALEGNFGIREENEDCIFGEEKFIFRNEASGEKNGMGLRLQDGSNEGTGFKRQGNGNRQNN
jgi:hypothetical protein